jgi:hypothetical protein
MTTKIDTLLGELDTTERSLAHKKALITALEDPSEWEYTGDVTDAGGGWTQAKCACGHPIRYEFHIIRPRDQKKAVVGSTCVDHFKSINPALGATLEAARDKLVASIREAEKAAKKATEEVENVELWAKYETAKASAIAAYTVAVNRQRSYQQTYIPTMLYWLACGGGRKYIRSKPPTYQRPSDLKRWIVKATEVLEQTVARPWGGE